MSNPGKQATLDGKAKITDMVHFTRGFFCAVAVLLREEGAASTQVRSLFKQGGDWRFADDVDIELFREHGLIAESEKRGLCCIHLRKRAGL